MKPYVPQSLPLTCLDYARLIRKVGPANAALARYDGLLQSVINPGVMLSPLTNREAVLSSKIEGTQATVDEVLEYEAGMEFEGTKVADIQEIVNYRKALSLATEALADRPLTLSLIKSMHGVLMDSVRGADKAPGQFRVAQNWLGPEGCAIDQATFVPPSPLQLLDHLEAFEAYLSSDDLDALIQAAVVHAQFELLHPFKDGNGRIGRLLIPLFLYQKRVLATPMFYLSEYLESHREHYYARLRAISQDGDWTAWVEFFLDAVIQQASANTERVRGILGLYERMKGEITDLTQSKHALKVLDSLFNRPIFQASDFVARSDIPKQTASRLLGLLRTAGILSILRPAGGRHSAVLVFRELLNCAEGRMARMTASCPIRERRNRLCPIFRVLWVTKSQDRLDAVEVELPASAPGLLGLFPIPRRRSAGRSGHSRHPARIGKSHHAWQHHGTPNMTISVTVNLTPDIDDDINSLKDFPRLASP